MRNDWCDVYFWIDGIVSIVIFFVVVLFVLVVVVGWIGIRDEDNDLIESLLGFDGLLEGFILEDDVVWVIEFVFVLFILKVLWLWLNLLFKKGKFKVFEFKDVFLFLFEDCFEVLYFRFFVNLEC